MKSYTDIEQSKELAKILPIESADMYYDYDVLKHEHYPMVMDEEYDDLDIPCWSLAALLSIINKDYYPELFYDGVAWTIKVQHHDIMTGDATCYCYGGGPVNACYEMILKLKERNLI